MLDATIRHRALLPGSLPNTTLGRTCALQAER